MTKFSTPPECHILLIEESNKQRSIILTAPTYSLGRDHRNAIVLNASIVSRQHALLLRVPEPGSLDYHYRIVDGNLAGTPSTNGIYVNGKKCVNRDLQMGDIVSIGGQVKISYLTCTLEPGDLKNYNYHDPSLIDTYGQISDPKDTLGNRPISVDSEKPTLPLTKGLYQEAPSVH